MNKKPGQKHLIIITLVLFALLCLPQCLTAQQHYHGAISDHLAAFLIHIEGAYLEGKDVGKIWRESVIEYAMLAGFALGKQALNVHEDRQRTKVFNIIMSDLEEHLGRKVESAMSDADEVTRLKTQRRLWGLAQEAMMGFHDDKVIAKYGIDRANIPNMFAPAIPGDWEDWVYGSFDPLRKQRPANPFFYLKFTSVPAGPGFKMKNIWYRTSKTVDAGFWKLIGSKLLIFEADGRPKWLFFVASGLEFLGVELNLEDGQKYNLNGTLPDPDAFDKRPAKRMYLRKK